MKVLGALVLGVLALVGFRYAIRAGFRRVVPSATFDQAATCVSLTATTAGDENGSTDIVGKIHNGCDRKFGQVTVSFKLDQSPSGVAGGQVSTSLDAKPERSPQRVAMSMPQAVVLAYVRDLQPGETRQFKSSTHIPRNAIFRVDRITGI